MTSINLSCKDLEKKAEALHNLVLSLQGQDEGRRDLEKENKQLTKDIDEIEEEWRKHKEEIQKGIREYENEIEAKKEKFNELKEKIKQYDENYEKLEANLRSDTSQIEVLQQEYAKGPKDVNILAYIKKINDTHNNLKKQKAEYAKVANKRKILPTSLFLPPPSPLLPPPSFFLPPPSFLLLPFSSFLLSSSFPHSCLLPFLLSFY